MYDLYESYFMIISKLGIHPNFKLYENQTENLWQWFDAKWNTIIVGTPVTTGRHASSWFRDINRI